MTNDRNASTAARIIEAAFTGPDGDENFNGDSVAICAAISMSFSIERILYNGVIEI